ncbi:hypothetical protein G6F22_018179 [Rhizopus arrhizus]|nr:hypothetical protein G6F22_018179 [Rhizopus arrhizus]
MQHGALLAAGNQCALRGIGPVGEGLGHHAQAALSRQREQGRTGQADQRQRRVDLKDGGDDVVALARVMRNGVVQRAMRLDVADLRARGRRQALERTDLIDDIRHQIGAGHVHVAPAETCQVRVGHVRAHRDAVGCSAFQRGQNTGGVARMETASHVRAGDQPQHCGVVAHGPGAQAFTQVAVQINRGHCLFAIYRQVEV